MVFPHRNFDRRDHFHHHSGAPYRHFRRIYGRAGEAVGAGGSESAGAVFAVANPVLHPERAARRHDSGLGVKHLEVARVDGIRPGFIIGFFVPGVLLLVTLVIALVQGYEDLVVFEIFILAVGISLFALAVKLARKQEETKGGKQNA